MKPANDGLDRRIDFRISRQTDKAMEKAAKELGISKSDLASEAVRRLLSRQSFDRCRAIAQPYAERMGIYTDDDVFRILEKQ